MHLALKELRRSFQYDLVEMPECGGEGLLIKWLAHAKTVVKFHPPAQLIMPTYDVRKADTRALLVRREDRDPRRRRAHPCSRFLANEVRNRWGCGAT
jgi:hypothetical protein